MFLIDYEYGGNNDPMWDLGDLSVEGSFTPEQDAVLLQAYFGHEPPAHEIGRMIAYKALCDVMWSLWGWVQFANGKRVAERLTAFDSPDGRAFSKVAEIDCTARPIRLLTGSMAAAGGVLRSGATAVVEGTVRATEVRFAAGQGWSVAEMLKTPSCDPTYLPAGMVMVRAPKSMDRTLLRDGAATPVTGYEGGPSAGGLLYESSDTIRFAQAEAAFPYPMHELVSTDRGTTWSKGRTIWGGSTSNAMGLALGDRRWLVFEGGDKARREHVLLLRLTTAEANPPSPSKSAVPQATTAPSAQQPGAGSTARP